MDAFDEANRYRYDPYAELHEDDFNGLYCACGRRMHASDTECRNCWRDREYPEEE